MSKYPSIEEYSNALQAARNTISDPKLAQGTVQTNNWGIPLARNGTFALTYKITAGGQDYAFRCFQRDRPGMHQRYTAISAALRKNSLPYFVTFDYLDDGITILTKPYPALVMQWAEGQPLSAYIEENKSRPTKLKALRSQIEALGQSLEAAGIAHGDIQTNNIVVADDGELRLVDYDGMYVPALKSKGALEAGHKNFQHPERERLSPYDASLDRFSFAVLYVGISALIEKPSYWNKLFGDPEALLLRATDFADPDNSEAFTLLTALPGAGEAAQRLMAISKAPYAEVPSFSDFLAGRNIPTKERTITSKPKSGRSGASKNGGEVPWYHEAAGTGSSQGSSAAETRYRVLDASDLGACLGAAGQEVELIGQIKKVTRGETGAGLPFTHLRLAVDIESSPEVLIWFQGMRALDYIGQQPNESWKGQWVSATGVMSSRGDAKTVTHPAVVIETANQFELITPGQAKFRLGGGIATTQAAATSAPQTNAEKLAGLGDAGKKATATPNPGGGGSGAPSATPVPATENRDWWPVALLAGVLGIIAIIFIFIAAANSSSGASGGSDYGGDSGVAVSTPANVTLASDQVGSCWNSAFTEVGCTSLNVAFQATAWVTSPSGCIDQSLEWEDGNYVCLMAKEPPPVYETCVTDQINGKDCQSGLGWTYSACWVYPEGILEQKIAGEWTAVATDFTVKDTEFTGYCEADYPYVVEFTRRESGPGKQNYNLYFPAFAEWSSENYPITVTVTQQ